MSGVTRYATLENLQVAVTLFRCQGAPGGVSRLGPYRPGQLEAWELLKSSRGLAGPVTLGGFPVVPALVGLGFPDRFPVVGLDILTGFRGVRAGVGGEFFGWEVGGRIDGVDITLHHDGSIRHHRAHRRAEPLERRWDAREVVTALGQITAN